MEYNYKIPQKLKYQLVDTLKVNNKNELSEFINQSKISCIDEGLAFMRN